MLLLLAGGCDPTVDRFQENDLYYSIFGYLNASADTQLVRVEPLRDGMRSSAPATLDVEVTLTNLARDRTVSLQDSLFHYREGAVAHNFYTTVDVEPSTPYRLVVRGPEGAKSRVRTTVPDAFPPPRIDAPIPACFPSCPLRGGPPDCGRTGGPESRIAIVSIEDVERLVAVKARYIMERPKGVWTYSHLADTMHTERGTVQARVDYAEDWCRIPIPEGQRRRRQKRIEIVVAAGSPDWPDFQGMDFETELLPGVASNVEGGVGFLGGVVTDTVAVYLDEE